MSPAANVLIRGHVACGEATVREWLWTREWRKQEQQLAATKVLLTVDQGIAGCSNWAMRRVVFGSTTCSWVTLEALSGAGSKETT